MAVTIAGLMVVSGCISASDARASLDLQVLLTIGAALGLGLALTESGAAENIAHGVVQIIGKKNPYVLLAVVYLVTLVFTEMITNTAVAALMFPLSVAVAHQGAVDPRPFVMAIAVAAKRMPKVGKDLLTEMIPLRLTTSSGKAYLTAVSREAVAAENDYLAKIGRLKSKVAYEDVVATGMVKHW